MAIVAPMIPVRSARRAQTVGERARGAERDRLCAVERLPMEALPKERYATTRCCTIPPRHDPHHAQATDGSNRYETPPLLIGLRRIHFAACTSAVRIEGGHLFR